MKLAILAQRNSIHTVRWANELSNRGYEVELISMQLGGDPLLGKIKFHTLFFKNLTGYFLNVYQLKRLLLNIKPDLLHVHYASSYGTLGRLSGYRPYVLSVWGSDVYDFPYRSPLYHRILVRNLRAADWICSTSQAMANQTRTLVPTLRNLTVTPFGVDVDVFKPLSYMKQRDVITVGTVKTLTDKYGIDTLVQAFARVKGELSSQFPSLAQKLRLLIVGDGPQKVKLQYLVKKLNLTEVTTFTGAVPHAKVPKYLNSLDVYVAASRSESESFGVAVVEASACAIPVVVSNTGGLAEVTRDSITGFVVPRDDIAAFARAILRLVQDKTLRKQMGEAGREHVLQNYNWAENVSIMEKVYARIVK